MQNFFDVVQTRTGDAIQGALITVYDSLGALATIYTDNGITTQTNPITTNADGEYSFYAADGRYSLTITATGYDTQTRAGIILFDAPVATASYAPKGAVTASGLTMTTARLLGRTTASTGAIEELTAAQSATFLQGDGLTVDLCGFRGIPLNTNSANYTTVAADAGKTIDHPASDANARQFTIAANASVAYPVGTTLTFTNMSANALTIAINSDTMYLAGAGTTGSRTLAQYGVATALKLTSTTWLISGTNLT